MDKFYKARIPAYAGIALMVIGLVVPYLRLQFGMNLSLLLNFGALGHISTGMYLLSFLGIAVTAYAAYVTFKSPKDYLKVSLAAAGYFLLLMVGFFAARYSVASDAGDFASLALLVFRLSVAPYFFLIGSTCYFFAVRNIAA